MRAITAWRLSIWLYRHGLRPLARIVQAYNFVVFHAVLPASVRHLGADVTLGHGGLGVVVHATTTIEDRVHIWHNVTISSSNRVDNTQSGVTLDSDCEVGTGSIVLCREGRRLHVGKSARVGAGAIVTSSVMAGETVACEPATPVGRAQRQARQGEDVATHDGRLGRRASAFPASRAIHG